MSYDDALQNYANELEARIERMEEILSDVMARLSEAHRQIAVLEDQLTHYYL